MRVLLKKILLCSTVMILLNPAPVTGQFYFSENPLIGESAPDFTLDTVKSGKQNMTDFRGGKSAIIFFWATWCPHCQRQLKELHKKNQQLSERNIKVILVDIQESSRNVRVYLEKNKNDMEVFLDVDSSVASEYGVIGVPTFFFVDQQGVVKAVEHDIPKEYEKILLEG